MGKGHILRGKPRTHHNAPAFPSFWASLLHTLKQNDHIWRGNIMAVRHVPSHRGGIPELPSDWGPTFMHTTFNVRQGNRRSQCFLASVTPVSLEPQCWTIFWGFLIPTIYACAIRRRLTEFSVVTDMACFQEFSTPAIPRRHGASKPQSFVHLCCPVMRAWSDLERSS